MSYDVAQYCVNGHLINPAAATRPGHSEEFCSRCGVETVTACLNCNAPFRGMSHGRVIFTPDRPAYCHHCGHAHPWTAAALAAANEFAVQMELSEMDRTELPALIEGLVKDTAQTTVAAARLKGLLKRVGPQVSEGFRTILVDVITEGAKKMIWP